MVTYQLPCIPSQLRLRLSSGGFDCAIGLDETDGGSFLLAFCNLEASSEVE